VLWVSIPKPALERCLQQLEHHAAHPGTPAIHDPIYGLLSGPTEAQALAFSRALACGLQAHSGHPAAAGIRAELQDYLHIPETDLASVLAHHGGDASSEDLVAAVDRLLVASAGQKRVMRARVETLERLLSQMRRSSNGVAALGAFALLFALLGWAVALGAIEVNWMDSPVPEERDAVFNGRGAP
jgi:hypothetical protein